MNGRSLAPRAFTLIEMIATVTILGIMGAAVLPVIDSAGSLYAESAATSRNVERAAFAIDRISRVLREIPLTELEDGLAISSIDSDGIAAENGTRIEVDGDRIMLTVDGKSAPLCEGVDAFEIAAFGADGMERAEAMPTETRRICVRLIVDGFEMRTAVFPRATMGVME